MRNNKLFINFKSTNFILIIILVGLIWASLVIFLSFYYSHSLNFSILLILIFIYLRLFIHENFSDIKDIKTDRRRGLLTLPVVLSQKKLFYILNSIFN